MMKKKKGFWGGLVAEFAFAIFVVLFILIFLFHFKYHLTLVMTDYYMWVKEYDIPLALFSIDIENKNGEYDSSAVFLSRLYYADTLGEDKNDLEGDLNRIIKNWAGEDLQYRLSFGDIICYNENKCACEREGYVTCPIILFFTACGKCSGECEYKDEYCVYRHWGPDPETIGRVIKNGKIQPYGCSGFTKVTHLGVYPVPVVFNGTQRITQLSFSMKRNV